MWLLSKYEPSEALGHKYLSQTFSLLQVASLQSTNNSDPSSEELSALFSGVSNESKAPLPVE